MPACSAASRARSYRAESPSARASAAASSSRSMARTSPRAASIRSSSVWDGSKRTSCQRMPVRSGRVIVPASGALHPGEKPQQRRLADAVLADQAEAVAGRDREGHIREHATIAVAARKTIGLQIVGRGRGRDLEAPVDAKSVVETSGNAKADLLSKHSANGGGSRRACTMAASGAGRKKVSTS